LIDEAWADVIKAQTSIVPPPAATALGEVDGDVDGELDGEVAVDPPAEALVADEPAGAEPLDVPGPDELQAASSAAAARIGIANRARPACPVFMARADQSCVMAR
jgi:hypothetical protein